MKLFALLFSTILVENYVFTRFLGICPFLGVSQKPKPAFSMGMAVTFVLFMTTLITHPIYTYLLEPNGLGYLKTLIFILVIASMVQIVEVVFKRYLPVLYKVLGIYLALITTNCIVLGAAILNIEKGYTYIESIVFSVGAGLGFTLAMIVFSGVQLRIREAHSKSSFAGLPLSLIAAGITSMAFTGFLNMTENLFRLGK